MHLEYTCIWSKARRPSLSSAPAQLAVCRAKWKVGMPDRSRPTSEDERAALVAARDKLLDTLKLLDELGMWQAGAHIAMAIDALGRCLSEGPPPAP